MKEVKIAKSTLENFVKSAAATQLRLGFSFMKDEIVTIESGVGTVYVKQGGKRTPLEAEGTVIELSLQQLDDNYSGENPDQKVSFINLEGTYVQANSFAGNSAAVIREAAETTGAFKVVDLESREITKKYQDGSERSFTIYSLKEAAVVEGEAVELAE